MKKLTKEQRIASWRARKADALALARELSRDTGLSRAEAWALAAARYGIVDFLCEA